MTGPPPGAAAAAPPAGDPAGESGLLPADGMELEERIRGELSEPEVAPTPHLLGRVASRLLSRFGRPAGTIAFATGAVDLLSRRTVGEISARPPGESLVERRPGDTIYAGETALTSRRTRLLLELDTGSHVWLGPATTLVAPEELPEEAGRAVQLVEGRMLCLTASPGGRAVTVTCPGGVVEVSAGRVAFAVEGEEVSRIEVFEGSAAIAARSGRATIPATKASAVSPSTAPAPEKGRGADRELGWLGAAGNVAELPAGARERLALLFPKGFPQEYAGPDALPSPSSPDGETGPPRRHVWPRRLVLGGVGMLLLGGGWAAWRWYDRRRRNPRGARSFIDPLRIPRRIKK